MNVWVQPLEDASVDVVVSTLVMCSGVHMHVAYRCFNVEREGLLCLALYVTSQRIKFHTSRCYDFVLGGQSNLDGIMLKCFDM